MRELNNIVILMLLISHSETTRVFPDSVTVVAGEEVMLRLEDPNENQTICFITTPDATMNYTVWTSGREKSESNPRIQFWSGSSKSGECGVRIRNVSLVDDGYWRLTSLQHDGKKRVGAAKVTVVKVPVESSTENYEVKVGSKQHIHLGPTGSEYCQIVIPGDKMTSHLVSGSCNLPVHKSMKNNSGNWTAMVGVRGKVEEVPASIVLNVEEERLDVGWEIINSSDVESISMYCNLRYSSKKVKFCRFLRLSDQVGFHLSDGLGNGRYSYFGSGLNAGDCGMSIETPDDEDYTQWECILGVGQNSFPMAAFLELKKANESGDNGSSIRTFHNERVMEVVGSPLVILCQAEASLKYCWFRHPNRTHLFPLDASESSGYEYVGRGLQMGDCGIQVKAAALTDSGEWQCHMGAEHELVTFTNVRITAKSLTTDEYVIKTLGSGNITLLCQSVPLGKSLVYCRFVRPDGYGLNLHDKTNKTILDRYSYYGDGLDKGHCGLLIHTIEDPDFGQWTCAAQLQGEAMETLEMISVELPDGSVASIGVGSAAALFITLVCILGIAIVVRRNRRRRRQSVREQEEADPDEMEMMPV